MCDIHLVLKLLCPLSISRDVGKVIWAITVILVHCMDGMTAVRGEEEKDKTTGRQKKELDSWLLAK